MIQLFLDNLWRWKCGMSENENIPINSMESLKLSEWDDHFEQLMRNRLVMGAIRYGRIGVVGKPQYDRVTSMIKRLQKYADNGNKEFLVDVANLCLLEFVECNHSKQHFHAVDEQEHVDVK